MYENETIQSIVRRAEHNYLYRTVIQGKYVSFQMHNVIETIDAYLNSKHITGLTDSLGREKPFFNIVTAATNIWYRATDLDRKNVKFTADKKSNVILALVANVFLQRWMDSEHFGVFLNLWGRALARYGSAVVKFVEQNGKLHCSVIPWNRFIADPVDFDAIPRIEKFYKTPQQLINMATKGHPDYAGYDPKAVKSLIETSKQTRKTLDKRTQDNQAYFLELYEVHGQLPMWYLDKTDVPLEKRNQTFRQQMHVVSFVKAGKAKDDYKDFTLYKGLEKKDPYMITHLIPEDNRTLSIGAVEYLFDAQWMTNHTIKQWKDQLDLTSKVILQTADPNYQGKNALNAIETGDIMVHKEQMPLTRIPTSGQDITDMASFIGQWRMMAQDVSNTPAILKGNIQGQNGGVSSKGVYKLAALEEENAMAIFELMTQNKAMYLEAMLKEYIIPHLRSQLNHSDELVAELSDMDIKTIDSCYVPSEAAKRFNAKAIPAFIAGNKVAPYDKQSAEAEVRGELNQYGNQRYLTPDDLGKATWKEILSDLNWEDIRTDITAENHDKNALLTALNTALQTIATNPMILQDPNASMLFSKILTETGVISPLEISKPSPMQQVGQGAPPAVGGQALPANQ